MQFVFKKCEVSKVFWHEMFISQFKALKYVFKGKANVTFLCERKYSNSNVVLSSIVYGNFFLFDSEV